MPNGIEVLYVDDEPGLLELGKLFLEEGGQFRVETITSAPAALALLDTKSYDAIISDYLMPGMDGIAFLKAVRERFSDLPFILFTGRGREAVVIQAINEGADFYLQKGGDPTAQFAELAHKVRQAVRRKRVEDTLYKNEERLRFALEGANDGIWDVNLPTGEFYLSPRGWEIIGYGPDEIPKTAKAWTDLINPEDLPATYAALSVYTDGKAEVFAVEQRLRTKAGDWKWVLSRGKIVERDTEGKPLRLTGTHTDITERKKAGDELRAAYEQIAAAEEELRAQYDELKINQDTILRERHFLSGIFSSIQDGISILDTTMNVLQVNPAMERWYAHAMPLIGKKCWEVYHNRSRPCDICPSIQCLKSGEPASATVPMTGSDGTTTGMLDLYSFPLRDGITGEVTGVIEYVRNVSARWKMQSQLEESEKRFRQLSDATNDALVMHKDGIILEVNSGACALSGYSRDELIGRNILDMVAPGSRATILEKIQTLYDMSFEVEGLKKNGSQFIGEVHTRNITYNNQQIRLTSVKDITERRQAEEELRAAYEQITATEEELRAQYECLALIEMEWESTFNSISDWISLITPEGKILRTNKAVESLAGISPAVAVGRNCFELIHGGDQCPAGSCPRRRMLGSRKREITEIQKHDRTGWLQITVDPVINQENNLISAVHIVRDITERVRSEKALETAKKKLNLLNEIVINDIQNQIFTVSGYQLLVKTKVIDTKISSIIDKQQEILQKITHSLKFSQSFQDLGLKPPKWQDARHVFLMAISHLDFLKIKHTILLDGLEIFADPLLEQVFQVIADNVLTHGKTATKVTLGYEKRPESVLLFIEDDGVGIPEEAKNTIFSPDFQKKKGAGLFLAREILEISGITIRETGSPVKVHDSKYPYLMDFTGLLKKIASEEEKPPAGAGR